MKRKKTTEKETLGLTPQRTAFDLMMGLQSDLLAETGLPPIPKWKKTHETPQWTKNICRNFKNTILKSVLKLKPKGKAVNWRNYGRCIGVAERQKTFLIKDLPQMLKEDGFCKISDKKWAEIKPLLGEEKIRQFMKKIGRKANDRPTLPELAAEFFAGAVGNLDKQIQTAFAHIAEQDAKTKAIFIKGMSEGFTIFLNVSGEFSGDDRRADIHFELLAWQYEIEKMRKSVLPKTRNDLFAKIKKDSEFKNKTQSWFNEVLKDIKLNGWKRGHPYKFSSS